MAIIYLFLSIYLMFGINFINSYSVQDEDEEAGKSFGTVKMVEDDIEMPLKTRELKGTCETLPSSIHVTKEEHDQAGNVIRSCEGNVMVNKCEGTCVSQLQPSVNTPTGFLKVRTMLTECFCCRESLMKQKEVFLTNCFDPDGKKIVGNMASMIILVHEPDQCKCHKCG